MITHIFASLGRKTCFVILRGLQLQNRAILSSHGAQNSLPAVSRLHLSSARFTSAGEGFHRPSDFDKRILVWTKMYPNKESIPVEVTNNKMKKAKDVFRIRVNIMMALVTILLCIFYISAGKDAVKRGESISQQNRDRHLEFQKKE